MESQRGKIFRLNQPFSRSELTIIFISLFHSLFVQVGGIWKTPSCVSRITPDHSLQRAQVIDIFRIRPALRF